MFESVFTGLLFMQIPTAVNTKPPEANTNCFLLMVLIALLGHRAIAFGSVLHIEFGGVIVATFVAGVLGPHRDRLTLAGLDEWVCLNPRDGIILGVALRSAVCLVVDSFTVEIPEPGWIHGLF